MFPCGQDLGRASAMVLFLVGKSLRAGKAQAEPSRRIVDDFSSSAQTSYRTGEALAEPSR